MRSVYVYSSSVKAIATLAKKCSLSWMSALFKMSGEFMLLSSYTEKCIDHFWQEVFNLKSLNGTEPRYVALPKVVNKC